MKASILLVDDDPSIRKVLAIQLGDAGYNVLEASDGKQAMDIFRRTTPHLLLTDLRMPHCDGITLLETVLSEDVNATVIVMTAYPTVETAVDIMRAGAFDFIMKPFKEKQVLSSIKRALKFESLKRENRRLRQIVIDLNESEPDSSSEEVCDAYRKALGVADTDITVLISGETGTGKEYLASFIHRNSPRATAPWVVVNCGALPKTMVEAELFGHTKGAFTGADAARPGRILSADGGTLFLDEIGDLPLFAQVKLLRFLQNGEIQPIGSDKCEKVNVRVIVATNKNLEEMVRNETFREDLFHRINVISLTLPPLRRRSEDILAFANSFINSAADEYGRKPTCFSPCATKKLESAYWPGNIRQLKNFCKRWVLLNPGREITSKAIMPDISFVSKPNGNGLDLPPEGVDFEKLEIKLIMQALKRTAGNQSAAAKLLGLTRHTFNYRVGKYKIRSVTE